MDSLLYLSVFYTKVVLLHHGGGAGPVRDGERPLQVDWGGAGRHQTQQGGLESSVRQVSGAIGLFSISCGCAAFWAIVTCQLVQLGF